MAKPKKKLEDLRSQRWYGPEDMRASSHRARSRQMGYSTADFGVNLALELLIHGAT